MLSMPIIIEENYDSNNEYQSSTSLEKNVGKELTELYCQKVIRSLLTGKTKNPCVLLEFSSFCLFTFCMDSRRRRPWVALGSFLTTRSNICRWDKLACCRAAYARRWIRDHATLGLCCGGSPSASQSNIFPVRRIGGPTYILAKLVVGSRLCGNICVCGEHDNLSIIGRLEHLYARLIGKHAAGHE
jgi:hypothetical protein